MGSAPIFFDNFNVKSLKKGLSIDTTFNYILFLLDNTFKQCSIYFMQIVPPGDR